MATFRKMKVTGPQCAEFITEPLQALRELNPSLNAMIQSTEQMNKVVCEAAKQPLKKRRKVASSAVAIHDAHLQRLKAYKSDTEHGNDPLTRSLAQLPSAPQPAPDVAAPPQSHAQEEDVSSLSSHAVMQRIVELLPPRNRNKAVLLGNFLKPHPSLIRISSTGRPIIGGKEIHGANILDIMRSLYVWRKGLPLPRGATEVIQALQSVGVPSGLLSTSSALTEYRRLLEKGSEEEEEEEQAAEGGEEEGTPQKFETPAHSSAPTAPPPPPPPLPLQPKAAAHLSTSSAALHVKAQKGSIAGKVSPSTSLPKPSTIPTATTKRTVSQTTAQTGQGYWPGRWLGRPLWPGFGQPKAAKPSLPGKPIRWLRLY
jgi:hypothetical protein